MYYYIMRDSLINKTIYMTYKKPISAIIKERWLKLNEDYSIEFSLDKDCIDFLRKNFNESVVDTFNAIERGMHKADLWRLCKLYVNGGVYADIDIIPHIYLKELNKNVTFYSCLTNENSIFQAFIVNNSKPNNPLILCFLVLFLMDRPDKIGRNQPTYHMYKCLSYNLYNIKIEGETTYFLNKIRIPINIGKSENNLKIINLVYFPSNIDCSFEIKCHNHRDTFKFKIENNQLYVYRTDLNTGWGYNHNIDICIQSEEVIYLFQEIKPKDWKQSYVVHNNNKILDSHDPNY